MSKKLDKLFKSSLRIKINDTTKLVIMSDCHRGSADASDNFSKNQKIYEKALEYYYNNGFVYIELGDGDEMWEVKDYKTIVNSHLKSFKLLKRFNDTNRLIMVYGNHDIEKRKREILKEYFYKYYDKTKDKYQLLLNELSVHESLVLNYDNHDLFLIHGHQVDIINSKFWKISRFLVRYIWKPLEKIGLKDPTHFIKNYKVKSSTEKKLKNWSNKNKKILIAGHTHRTSFPQVGKSLYFNDGSCVYPDGITCLEMKNGNISLVNWKFKINKGDLVSFKREVLSKNIPIINFFESIS